MVLAYDYPLLGMFWTFLIFFIWIAWIVVLFRVIFDIFRSKDLGGFAKALWVIFVIIVPFLGVLVYLIARGHSMSERDYQEAKSQEQAFQSYVRSAAGTGGGSADELTKLADLRDKGVITDAEFQQQKAKLLA
jgi:ABC-type multidrug transport system fused ATPase/permease subunit